MFDWNGDGKIDPIDIGITMSMLEEDENQHTTNGSGCLPAVMMAIGAIGAIGCFAWMLGSALI